MLASRSSDRTGDHYCKGRLRAWQIMLTQWAETGPQKVVHVLDLVDNVISKNMLVAKRLRKYKGVSELQHNLMITPLTGSHIFTLRG